MKIVALLLLLPFSLLAQKFTPLEITRWTQRASQVTIVRDKWGIAHVSGKTDADAVFGLLYAQCEDDFRRVEMNYLEKLGRTAEVEGESALYADLLNRLVLDSAEAVADYAKSPAWLRKLLDAYADGINYYIHKNPSKPLILKRFKPWYQLLWTDGSIGAISTGGVTLTELRNFYSSNSREPVAFTNYTSPPEAEPLPSGSNGFAIAGSKTESGNAILYINPHVTFYFRPEIHMQSQEGLNAYGAVTWGQFFIYQGFNPYCGWMHTSSAVDVADIYEETVVKKTNKYYYNYNGQLKPVVRKSMTFYFKKNDQVESKTILAYYTQHGPVMAERNGKWISLKASNRSLNGLMQSWQRTKAKGFEDFKKIMDLRANTSNNTVFADNKGNIAYWHGNFIPKRDTKYNWAKAVDGTTSATEWKGLHTVDESVHLYNPANGWIQNCNSTPFTAAGDNSPKEKDYPSYMAPDGENFRGLNAVRVLSREQKFNIDKVIAAGYDNYLSAFSFLIPALVKAYDANANDSSYAMLKEPIQILREWNYYSGEKSVATTLAIEWGQKIIGRMLRADEDYEDLDQVERTQRYVKIAPAKELLDPLKATINDLKGKFNDWKIEWGTINRYQRLTGMINEKYDDNQPSLPVGMAASTWGALPSYVSRTMQGTKKRYGFNGNSFICAVEFGKKIKAKSLLAGGVSGEVNSKHFGDQAEMYTKGIFKDVLFYNEDILKNAERTYRPGEEKK
jgi:acyl-homoserine-lactone acylase